jgi:hypothetical protein
MDRIERVARGLPAALDEAVADVKVATAAFEALNSMLDSGTVTVDWTEKVEAQADAARRQLLGVLGSVDDMKLHCRGRCWNVALRVGRLGMARFTTMWTTRRRTDRAKGGGHEQLRIRLPSKGAGSNGAARAPGLAAAHGPGQARAADRIWIS